MRQLFEAVGPMDLSVQNGITFVRLAGPGIDMMQPVWDRTRNSSSMRLLRCYQDICRRETLIEALIWTQSVEVFAIHLQHTA